MLLDYALITPMYNEVESLPRLASSVLCQTVMPSSWVLVDTGSTDDTSAVCRRLAGEHAWIRLLPSDRTQALPQRGGRVVQAFTRGLEALERSGPLPEVVVKLDADLELDPDHFERLVTAFAADPLLGIASGGCTEFVEGEWRPLFGTRQHVWGNARAYRRSCLEEVLPIEERQGWDELDALRARLTGWHTGTVPGLWFRHLRTVGQRDGQRRHWIDQGDTAHYMGYRPTYLLARAMYKARTDRAALLMLWGYARAISLGKARLPDPSVRRYLREQQRLRHLRLRANEARGDV